MFIHLQSTILEFAHVQSKRHDILLPFATTYVLCVLNFIFPSFLASFVSFLYSCYSALWHFEYIIIVSWVQCTYNIQLSYPMWDVSVDFEFQVKKLVIIIIVGPGNSTTTSHEIVAVQSHFGYHKFDDDDGCFNKKISFWNIVWLHKSKCQS